MRKCELKLNDKPLKPQQSYKMHRHRKDVIYSHPHTASTFLTATFVFVFVETLFLGVTKKVTFASKEHSRPVCNDVGELACKIRVEETKE